MPYSANPQPSTRDARPSLRERAHAGITTARADIAAAYTADPHHPAVRILTWIGQVRPSSIYNRSYLATLQTHLAGRAQAELDLDTITGHQLDRLQAALERLVTVLSADLAGMPSAALFEVERIRGYRAVIQAHTDQQPGAGHALSA